MKTARVPGKILRTTVFLGLTFDELVVLGAVPLVVVLPSLYIDQIPLVGSMLIIVVSALGVVVVAFRTPDGQTPVEWAPAAFKRRVTPDTYYLKPKAPDYETVTYQDRILTADQIRSEATADEIPGGETVVQSDS